jgi:hypothetical protein
MYRHQIASDIPTHRLPLPPAPSPEAGAFALWPVVAAPAVLVAVELLYRTAFEHAQAVARPSVLQRDLLAVAN